MEEHRRSPDKLKSMLTNGARTMATKCKRDTISIEERL